MSSHPEPDEASPYQPEEAAYDPGSAFVDENQDYGTADPTLYDPNQAYYDPNQAHYDPNASSEAPAAEEAAYVPPPPPVHDAGVYDEGPVEAPAPAPVLRTRSAAPKKKVARTGTARKKAAPSKGKRPAPKPVYDGGVSFATVLLTLVALALVGVFVMVILPKDLSAIAGYPTDPAASDTPRNLLAEMQQAILERSNGLAFTEEEVNRYLDHRLAGEQSGPLGALVRFRGVCIDFSPGKAEIVIERELFGKSLTTSVDIEDKEFRGQAYYQPAAWHLGRITLGARTVKPVVDLFVRLRNGLRDEYDALQEFPGLRFEENRVIIVPEA